MVTDEQPQVIKIIRHGTPEYEEQQRERQRKWDEARAQELAALEKMKTVKIPTDVEHALRGLCESLRDVEKVALIRSLNDGAEGGEVQMLMRAHLPPKRYNLRRNYYDAFYLMLLHDVIDELCALYLNQFYEAQSASGVTVMFS